jgi:hypothetical protein
MKTKSLIALAAALAVNAAALAGLNTAMTEGVQRAQLAQAEPERVVVTAKRLHTETAAAKPHRAGSRS